MQKKVVKKKIPVLPAVPAMPKSLKVTVPTWAGTAPGLSGDHMWHAPLHCYISVPTSNQPTAFALKYAPLNALTCQEALMHSGPCNL